LHTTILQLSVGLSFLPLIRIGNPEEDLGLLREAEAAISGISDAEIRAEYQGEVAEMRKSIYAYLNGGAET